MSLRLSNVETRYGHIRALKGVSFEVNEGEIVTLIGANGAGKTTTLMTISGLCRAAEGTIEFNGKRIDRLSPAEIVEMGICQVPEGRHIFPRLTVRENLNMGAYLRRNGQEVPKDIERVFELFPILREREQQRGGTLSGGEQQMLAIGRALMARPKLLLLDEPSLGLAPVMVKRIFEILREISRGGTTLLLVEQNALIALSAANRGYVMETGKVVLMDDADKLLSNPAVRKAYLGE